MKTIKKIVTSSILMLFVSVSLFAQSNAKILAVVNEAEWCPTCQHNGERAMKAFKENNKDGNFKFVMNNLTNDKTKAESGKELASLELTDAVAPYKGTGMVYFFDAKTKTLISKISIAKSDKELADAMLSAKKGISCCKPNDGKSCDKSKEHSCG